MPSIDCRGCSKSIRNPPSYKLTRPITGYCAKCLGLAHKTRLKVELSAEILDKLNLTEKHLTIKTLLDCEIEYKLPKCKKHKGYYKVATTRTGNLAFYCDRCQSDLLDTILLNK